jgi:hypothetical protein
MKRVWHLLGWTAWIVLAALAATAFYVYLVISNA